MRKMKSVPPNFDETSYLTANPDVAAAVKSGIVPSGAEHYVLHGFRENRSLSPYERAGPLRMPFAPEVTPTRRDKILANLNPHLLEGLEIGALASPLVKPEEGRIFFVDHVDTETLRKKYAIDPSIDQANIANVDAVWGAQTLQECIGADRKVDYVVASHVIEHVPDLITWLSEIHSVLRPTGSLRLAIPDRRYTFDYMRFESRIHDVLDAYLKRARAPVPRLIIEHFSLIRVVDNVAAWNGTLDPSKLKPYNSTKDGLELAKDAIENGTYQDTHCWVFTPVSFAELCREMAELDLLKFACAQHFETARNEIEFFAHLVPSTDKDAIVRSWSDMKSTLLQSKTYQRSPRDSL
jgi:SAM-dependent methyltransferase